MASMYPLLEIDCDVISKNASRLLTLCREHGVEPAAVIKGFNGDMTITSAIIRSGYKTIASSRLVHLRAVKAAFPHIQTMALRIPMISEVEDVVECADISLNSQKETLEALNAAAESKNVIHKVILMRDLGDLREGVISTGDLVSLAEYVDKKLKSLYLYGIGTNLTCYGSVIPTEENMSVLAADACEIEKRIGRTLDVVSGGATTTVPLMVNGHLPRKINHLRIGTCIVIPKGLLQNWDVHVDGLSNSVFTLSAEIVEIGDKPTHPIGRLKFNCFNNECSYEDNGIRKRALLAIGSLDIGDCSQLRPIDKNMKILGASSDHLIVDIQDCGKEYHIGDVISFRVWYQAMLFAFSNSMVTKRYRVAGSLQ